MHQNLFININPQSQPAERKEGESALPNPSSNNLSSNVYSEKNKAASDDENLHELSRRLRNNKTNMEASQARNGHFNDAAAKINTVDDIFRGQTPRLQVMNMSQEINDHAQNTPARSFKTIRSIKTLATDKSKKFKKRSDFESDSALSQILETKSRISINSSTGQYDFMYQNQVQTGQNGEVKIVPVNSLKKGSAKKNRINPKVANCLFNKNGENFKNAGARISRPSDLIWQLPYAERKKFIEMDNAQRLSKLKMAQQAFYNFQDTKKTQNLPSASNGPKRPSKNGSTGKNNGKARNDASFRDSEFENIDDYIDDHEECGGLDKKTIKFSIKCIDFQMMISEKQIFDYMSSSDSTQRRMSLLSRASSIIISNQMNSVKPVDLGRASPLDVKARQTINNANDFLNSYVNAPSASGQPFLQVKAPGSVGDNLLRISSSKSMESALNIMSNIDERDETSSSGQAVQNPKASPTHQCSKLSTAYNLQTFFTPSQRSKKMNFDSSLGRRRALNNLNPFAQQPCAQSFQPKLDLYKAPSKSKDNQAITEEEDIVQEESNESSGKLKRQSRSKKPSSDPLLEPEKQFTFAVAEDHEEEQDDLTESPVPIVHVGRESKSNKLLQKFSIQRDEQRDQNRGPSQEAVNSPPIKAKREASNTTEQQSNPNQNDGMTPLNNRKEKENTGRRNSPPRADDNHSKSESVSINQGCQVDQKAVEHQEQPTLTQRRLDFEFDALEEIVEERDEQADQMFPVRLNDKSDFDSGNRLKELNCNTVKESIMNSKQGEGEDPRVLSPLSPNEPMRATIKIQPIIEEIMHNLNVDKQQSNPQQVLSSEDEILNKTIEPSQGPSQGMYNGNKPCNKSLQAQKPNPFLDISSKTFDNQENQQVSHFDAIDARYLQIKRVDSEKQTRQKHLMNFEEDRVERDDKSQEGLSRLVTKVPQPKEAEDSQNASSELQGEDPDLHRKHFLQTINQLKYIRSNLKIIDEDEMASLRVTLPPPKHPNQKKLAIFDMDETLIHCVDDIEKQETDVVLEIDFPDEEPVYAGVNIRPYIMECLQEASKNYQVIVFTASHQTYADAILDYIDPKQELIQHRLYRQHCVLTPDGYYVKDLRIFNPAQFDQSQIVIIDNSVFSFAFQIDNGIPIIPFYDDKSDEEMLHLIYYLNCLASSTDIRESNKQAFELSKLSSNSSEAEEADSQDDQLDMEPTKQISENTIRPPNIPNIPEIFDKSYLNDQNTEQPDSMDQHSKLQDLGLSKEVPDQTFRNIDFVRRASVVEAEIIGKDSQKAAYLEDLIKNQNVESMDEMDIEISENLNKIEHPKTPKVQELEDILKNIYQNLIDEDDIIIEEESREGVSSNTQQQAKTARLSEIQLLQINSNYSNNTGSELQKLVKLIKNNSYGSNKHEKFSKDNSYMISSEKYDKASNTQSKLKEIGVIHSGASQNNVSEVPAAFSCSIGQVQSNDQESRTGENVSGSNQTKSNLDENQGTRKVASMGSIPPIGESSAMQGSIPQSSANKQSATWSIPQSSNQKSAQATQKSCGDNFQIDIKTFDPIVDSNQKTVTKLNLLHKMEIDDSNSKKSHRQIIQSSQKTELLDSIQPNHSTSKTTKKKEGLQSHKVNDLHVRVLKFEDQTQGETKRNAHEFLGGTGTPAVIADGVVEGIQGSMPESKSPQSTPPKKVNNIYKREDVSKFQNVPAGQSGKSKSQVRRSRHNRTAARQGRLANQAQDHIPSKLDKPVDLATETQTEQDLNQITETEMASPALTRNQNSLNQSLVTFNQSQVQGFKGLASSIHFLQNQTQSPSLISFKGLAMTSSLRGELNGQESQLKNTNRSPCELDQSPRSDLEGSSDEDQPKTVPDPKQSPEPTSPKIDLSVASSPPQNLLTRSIMSRQARNKQISPNDRYKNSHKPVDFNASSFEGGGSVPQ